MILRSDNGDTWREHTLDATEEAVQDVLNESFEGEGKVCLHFCVVLCSEDRLGNKLQHSYSELDLNSTVLIHWYEKIKYGNCMLLLGS